MNKTRGSVRPKVSVFVGVSLDGFLARENGDLDWMQGPGGAGGGDYGYDDFIKRIDVLVMGRGTFEKVLTFTSWPYGEMPVIVLTHRPIRIPTKLRRTVESSSGAPKEILNRLVERGWLRVYVDGGRTIQAFLAAGVVDELVLSRLPILIGAGIPLFGPLPEDVRLTHVGTRPFAGGMVQSTYEVERLSPRGLRSRATSMKGDS